MTDNEFILFDRIQKIKSIISLYGEQNFRIDFSGGKDSCVMHTLIDEALPGNKIPRVYSNTGIQYQIMVNWVKSMAQNDERIVIIPPQNNIRQVLQENGYPFASKNHSIKLSDYRKSGLTQSLRKYRERVQFSLKPMPAQTTISIHGR